MPRRDLHDWFWHVSADFTHLSVERLPQRLGVVANRFWQPRIDVLEDDRVIVVKAELAGVRIENLHLAYAPGDHTIVMRGVRNEEDLLEMGRTGIHQLEIFYGEFEREIQLPAHTQIDPERIHASFKNGFLIVLAPKVGDKA